MVINRLLLYSCAFFPKLEQNLEKRTSMKHLLRFLLALTCMLCTLHVSAEIHNLDSRSFTILRPAYDLIETFHHLVDPMQYDQERSGTAQGYFVYQHAQDHNLSQSKFARYFLFHEKNQLLVAGDESANACFRDIRAEWLSLNPEFSGYLSVCPEHRQYGGVLSYHQNLDKVINHGFFEQTFVSVTIPIINVMTSLNLNQAGVQNPGDRFPRDIIEAFNQPSWFFDKIAGSHEKTAVADITFRFGRVFMNENDNWIVYYSGLVIPAAPKPDPEFLYNAYVGERYHVGFNGGLNIQVRLNRTECDPLWAWFVMLDGTYLFKNTQYRTLDLYGPNRTGRRPWSRFLPLTRACTPGVVTPGVNILTQKMHVRPYGVYNFASGFRFKNNWYEIEVGYNLWGHPQEFLKLEDRFYTDYGILGVIDPLTPTVAQSASLSTIKTQAPNDPTFITIKESDLDIYSGSAGSALNHTFLLSFGIHQLCNAVECTFGGGLYTEIAHMNRPVPSWGSWLKIGFSF